MFFISNVVFFISKSSIGIFFTSSTSLLFYNLVFLSLLNMWGAFIVAVLKSLSLSYIISALWVCFFYFSTTYRSYSTPCMSRNLFIGCQMLWILFVDCRILLYSFKYWFTVKILGLSWILLRFAFDVCWCRSLSTANFASLLHWYPSEDSTQCPVFCETFPLGWWGHRLFPVLHGLQDCSALSFLVDLSLAVGISSHECSAQYSAKDLRGHICQCPGLSLGAVVSSLDYNPQIVASLLPP